MKTETKTDNKSLKNCWILSSGCNVTLCTQKVGENPSGSVTLSKREFSALCNWYIENQTKKK